MVYELGEVHINCAVGKESTKLEYANSLLGATQLGLLDASGLQKDWIFMI